MVPIHLYKHLVQHAIETAYYASLPDCIRKYNDCSHGMEQWLLLKPLFPKLITDAWIYNWCNHMFAYGTKEGRKLYDTWHEITAAVKTYKTKLYTSIQRSLENDRVYIESLLPAAWKFDDNGNFISAKTGCPLSYVGTDKAYNYLKKCEFEFVAYGDAEEMLYVVKVTGNGAFTIRGGEVNNPIKKNELVGMTYLLPCNLLV